MTSEHRRAEIQLQGGLNDRDIRVFPDAYRLNGHHCDNNIYCQ